MFKGNTNTSGTKTTDLNSPDRLNRIVEGTTIHGEINSESNIRIDGFVKGTVSTHGRLVIGPTGIIEGEVFCQNADVEGLITGSLKVNDLLTLKSTAKINGDINTSKLAIEPGAEFTGACNMSSTDKSPRKKVDNSSKEIVDDEDNDVEMTVNEILEERSI